ncbi:MAG: RdgB/HAM1 family non-canonical purine NTP pyrophosphatase [Candidatus Moraniibacteriota bacterium]
MNIQYFATTSDHKLREVNHMLGYELEKIHLELTEPQDMDVEVIARAKAEEAFQKVGELVLVEDFAWYLDVWNGLPGPFVKYFVQTVGSAGILKMLGDEQNRKALAKTVVAYNDGTQVHVFVGELSGTVATEMRGESGFGLDPIFIPDGHTKTFAEMSAEEKNSVSMRALAVNQLKEFLNQETA